MLFQAPPSQLWASNLFNLLVSVTNSPNCIMVKISSGFHHRGTCLYIKLIKCSSSEPLWRLHCVLHHAFSNDNLHSSPMLFNFWKKLYDQQLKSEIFIVIWKIFIRQCIRPNLRCKDESRCCQRALLRRSSCVSYLRTRHISHSDGCRRMSDTDLN